MILMWGSEFTSMQARVCEHCIFFVVARYTIIMDKITYIHAESIYFEKKHINSSPCTYIVKATSLLLTSIPHDSIIKNNNKKKIIVKQKKPVLNSLQSQLNSYRTQLTFSTQILFIQSFSKPRKENIVC